MTIKKFYEGFVKEYQVLMNEQIKNLDIEGFKKSSETIERCMGYMNDEISHFRESQLRGLLVAIYKKYGDEISWYVMKAGVRRFLQFYSPSTQSFHAEQEMAIIRYFYDAKYISQKSPELSPYGQYIGQDVKIDKTFIRKYKLFKLSKEDKIEEKNEANE
jgi:hypothetical protein